MKWAKSCKHRPDYYAWQDLSHVMFVTLVIAVIASLVIALLVFILSPGVATAGDVTNYRQARRLAAPTLHSDMPVTRHSVPVVTILCEISAYTASVAETDGNPLITASGQRVRVGGIAADLRKFPLGTILRIPNYNNGKPCTVIDSGGSIRGNKLDVFMWHESEAVHFGRRRNVKVQVLYVPKATS